MQWIEKWHAEGEVESRIVAKLFKMPWFRDVVVKFGKAENISVKHCHNPVQGCTDWIQEKTLKTRNHRKEGLILFTRAPWMYKGSDRCTECVKDSDPGPFQGCCGDPKIKGGACANCVWRQTDKECTLKDRVQEVKDEGKFESCCNIV